MRLGGSMRRRRGPGRRSDEGREAWLPGSVRLIGASVLVILVGFGIGWFFATRVLFPAPPPPDDLVEVPEVRGSGLEDAVSALDEAGLLLDDVAGVRHPVVDSGQVLGQAPLPGQLAPPDASVRVTVSLGPERRGVPDVVELRGDRARTVLEATGFQVALDSVENDLPAGRVVEVDPEAGTEVALPGEVRLVISLGPPRVAMPFLYEMTEEEARDTLAALGLVVERVDEVFRFGRDQGIVVGQSPPADSLVEEGTPVRLEVGRRSSLGGPPVEVEPDTSSAGRAGNKEPTRP